LFVNPDTHPADKALGPLGDSPERGVDEVSGGPDDVSRYGVDVCRFGSALLLFLLQLVTQSFALTEILLEEQQQIMGKAFEDAVTLLGREGTGPGFALVGFAFELVEDLFDIPAVFVEQDDLKELADARTAVDTTEGGVGEAVEAIHRRFSYRMQDLGEFMKGLLQRFSQWFNRAHSRSGTLWEDRFKSVIVEDGVAARTMSAYIDLNPLRAGMVQEPADYRWSSYGEAVGGGKTGNGKKARDGLVRAYFSDQGAGFDAGKWQEVSRLYRRLMGLALGKKPGRAELSQSSKGLGQATKNTAEMLESEDNETVLKDLGIAKMLRCRIRYFTDGAVIGSKEFVNEAFASARDRFGPKRKDGARKLKGAGAAASGTLWSLRDLRKESAS
jgi:putative transposase